VRIAIVYPPIKQGNEYPLLGQNRQFKYSNSLEIRIYPVVMATLATMLKNDGHEVLWLDGINERLEMADFENRLKAFNPDMAVMETKAPIIKRHWEYMNGLKDLLPKMKLILVGDHVCFYPEESFAHSKMDFVVSSGDYDFVIRDLVRYWEKKNNQMPGSVHWKQKGKVVRSGPGKFYELDAVPVIDRVLTRWEIYGEAYLYRPVAYILSGRGCGGANSKQHAKDEKKYCSSLPGRCAFCVWQYGFWKAGVRMRKPEDVALEIKHLVEKFHVKEIFDDNESGGTWSKEWLQDFYKALRTFNVLGKVRISSNARADSLVDDEMCGLLKKCGYRLLKIGVESGNNSTLGVLRKDETIETIMAGIKNAKRHGMVVLMTTMVGYPWETEDQARKTFDVTRELMLYKTHFGDSLQSSIIVPYPGTPLYNEALKKKWFAAGIDPKDYEKFDMAHNILKTDVDTEFWCKKMWRIHLDPVFLLKSFLSLRRFSDIALAFRGVISLLGHLRDYKA